MSNQSRGLERHVDPSDPTGKLIDHLPDAHDKLKAELNAGRAKPLKSSKKKTRKKSKKKS